MSDKIDNLIEKLDQDIATDDNITKLIDEAESAIVKKNHGGVAASFAAMSWYKIAIYAIIAIVLVAIIGSLFSTRVRRTVKKIGDRIDDAFSGLDGSVDGRNIDNGSSSNNNNNNAVSKYVRAADLSPSQPRFEFFFQDWCPACKNFKPVLRDYVDHHSASNFRIIFHNCAENTPENASCNNFTHIPVFLYRSNAADSAGTIYTGAATVSAITAWVASVSA